MDILIGFVGVLVSLIIMTGDFKDSLGLFVLYLISFVVCMVVMPDILEILIFPVEYWYIFLIIPVTIENA